MPSKAASKLATNTGALFALQIANYILPFIIIPFLTRTLGVSTYGVVAFGLATSQLACILTDFGFNLSATRQIANHQNNKEHIRKVAGAVYLSKTLLLLPVTALIYAFIELQAHKYGEYALFFWLLLIPIVGQTFQPIWLFQGIERMGFITVFIVIARSSYVILAITLISKPEDYLWVAITNGTSQVIAAVIAIAFMAKLGYFPKWPGWAFTNETFSASIEFFWSRAAVATYTAGGAFYLGIFSTPTAVAYYSAAEQLYKGAQALLQPVSQALFPYMTRTKDLKLFFRILKWSVAISFIGLLAGLLLGEWFLTMLFGAEFTESYVILVAFMIAFCITTPSILYGYPLLGALGDTRSANRSVFLGGLVQALALITIYNLNMSSGINIAISVIIAEILVLIYRTRKARKIIHSTKNLQHPLL